MMGRKRSRSNTTPDYTPADHVNKKLKNAEATRTETDNNSAPSPSTPSIANQPTVDDQPTPLSKSSTKGRSGQMLEAGSGVTVEIHTEGEGYVLRINRKSISSSSHEHKVEEATQMAQSAGMLFLQAEILRDMAEQLLAQSRESFQYAFRKPASQNPRSLFSG